MKQGGGGGGINKMDPLHNPPIYLINVCCRIQQSIPRPLRQE